MVEVEGALPMLLKTQRRATVELGFTPSARARARVNADTKEPLEHEPKGQSVAAFLDDDG